MAARIDPRRLVDHQGAAEILTFRASSLQRPDFRARLQIPHYKIGRYIKYDVDDLQKWAARQRVSVKV